MNAGPASIPSATRTVDSALESLLASLKAGDPIRIIQRVRVGRKEWTATVLGAFRSVNFLATGLSTHRVAEDDVIVPLVHFTKENGELSSIAVDGHTQIERV